MRFRLVSAQRLAVSLFVVARLAAFGESVEVQQVLGPSSFRAADGRTVRYFGLSSPAGLETPDREELRSRLTQQHGDLLLGKAVGIVPRTHGNQGPNEFRAATNGGVLRTPGNQADRRVPAFVFHGDMLLNVEVLRLGLAVLDTSALGKLGAYEEQFLEAQLEAAKAGRGIWQEQPLGGLLVGSRRSQKVHQPFCPWAYKVGAKNRALFEDAGAAFSAGMTACAVCFSGQEIARLQVERAQSASAAAKWAIWAVALAACGVVVGLLARTARAKRLLKALKRMRAARQALAQTAAPAPASRHRPPARQDCDLSALLARCHPRWQRYLADRSVLWYWEAPPAGVVAATPEAEVKRLLTSFLVHLRDRLPAQAVVHSRLSASSDAVTLAFSVSIPREAFAELVPSQEAVRAWRADLPREAATIEVAAEPGTEDGPRPLLAIILPRKA